MSRHRRGRRVKSSRLSRCISEICRDCILAVLPAEVPSSVDPGNGFARSVSETTTSITRLLRRALFGVTVPSIGLLSNTVRRRGDDASGRHDGRWNLLSIGGRRSIRLTFAFDRRESFESPALPSREHLFEHSQPLIYAKKMLQDGICDTADILNSVPPKKVFMLLLLLSFFLSSLSYLPVTRICYNYWNVPNFLLLHHFYSNVFLLSDNPRRYHRSLR